MPRPLYRFTSSFPLLSALFFALFVTACGGGGGAVNAPPVVVEPPAPPADTTPPTITLSGDAEMRVEQGTEFTDPGASANDDTDGEVTVLVSGTVDTATAGVYTLTYTATDAAGNEATAERVVTVSEDEMKAAVRHYYTDTHNLVEGAGAASLAAMLQEKDAMSGKKVGLILSGGNIDRELYLDILSEAS